MSRLIYIVLCMQFCIGGEIVLWTWFMTWLCSKHTRSHNYCIHEYRMRMTHKQFCTAMCSYSSWWRTEGGIDWRQQRHTAGILLLLQDHQIVEWNEWGVWWGRGPDTNSSFGGHRRMLTLCARIGVNGGCRSNRNRIVCLPKYIKWLYVYMVRSALFHSLSLW